MEKQTRQTDMIYNAHTEEYQIRLFINGEYHWEADYFTNDLKDAQDTAKAMKKGAVPQKDFCKESGKSKKKKIEQPDEWPIHNESGDLIGWLDSEASESLPEVLCIRDKAYVQIKI